MTLTVDHSPAVSRLLKERTARAEHRLAPGANSFSASRVSLVVKELSAETRQETNANWLRAVTALVSQARPDIAIHLAGFLGFSPAEENLLGGMSIGEIGVIYEALVALADGSSRRSNGQYFTPDDAAAFMARQSRSFPSEGIWLDPCTGVGNLVWHLAAAQDDPADFVRNRLALIDMDGVALKTAVALLVASFSQEGDAHSLAALWKRCQVRDALTDSPLPEHRFAILNPPYARTARREGYTTAASAEFFAYFLERVATTSEGFIAVTPASYLNVTRYSALRELLSAQMSGGDVFVFDNVPDTLFRGFKFGSTNSSKTNFVRAAITVCAPSSTHWRITPILRWAARSRQRMLDRASDHLVGRRIGPDGEWAKVARGTEQIWDAMSRATRSIGEMISHQETQFRLEIASTPRYYISATERTLDRSSKHVLFFHNRDDLEAAFLLLNSSLPYWWWRSLDGGVTLPTRVIRSLPVPEFSIEVSLVDLLRDSETNNVVTKLNAGRHNENVKHPRELVAVLDRHILGSKPYDFSDVYAPDMFSES